LFRFIARNIAPPPVNGFGSGPGADWDHAAILSAANPLDADHLGAEIAQQRGAERSRDVTPEIEDANAVEHTSHALPPAPCRASRVTPSLSPGRLQRMLRLQRRRRIVRGGSHEQSGIRA
jgi:hypothetical protein